MMQAIPNAALTALAALALLAPTACEDADPAGLDEEELAGGVLATFDVSGEEFRVWTTNVEAIEQLEALEAGQSAANIPTGILREGPGRGDHNEPWSWHLDPESVSMAEVTVEVCDGRPSFVEEDLDYWLNQVGQYCPWSAELVSLEDFRR